jgi:O-antigen/teichoic acid export membrane protein
LTGVSDLVAASSIVAQQVLLARVLSAAAFGEFVALQALVTFVEGLFVARAGEVALRWVGRTWQADKVSAVGYAKFLARREFVWNVAVYGLFAVGGVVASHELSFSLPLLLILAASLPAQSGYGASKSVFVADGRLTEQAWFEIGTNLLSLCLCGVLLLVFGLLGFAIGAVTAAVAKNFVARRMSRSFWPADARDVSAREIPSASASAYSFVRNLFSNFSANGDVMLLSLSASQEHVAVYKVARSIANLPGRAAAPLWTVLRPAVLRALDTVGERPILAVVGKPALLFLLSGIVAAPIAYWMSLWFFAWLYGPGYAASGVPFLILLPAVWWYSAISGWFGFLSIVSVRKLVPTLVFGSVALLMLVAGWFFGSTPQSMAAVVAASFAVGGLLAWALLALRSDWIAR